VNAPVVDKLVAIGFRREEELNAVATRAADWVPNRIAVARLLPVHRAGVGLLALIAGIVLDKVARGGDLDRGASGLDLHSRSLSLTDAIVTDAARRVAVAVGLAGQGRTWSR
jgi:hypothetical protein